MTLGIAMLVGGLVIAFLILADGNLAESTHWRAGGLLVVYFTALSILYGGCSHSTACSFVYIMWENLGNELGRDAIALLWQVSMFASFTIGASGTRSTLWNRVGGAIFLIFILALAVRIWPR